MDNKAILKYIEVARRALDLVEQQVLGKEVEVSTEIQVTVPVVEDNTAARKKHVEALLAIDCWPEAIAARSAAKPTTSDQINRANSVLDMMIDKSLDKAHFLDYGCGEGYVAKKALDRGAATSTAYDLVSSTSWDDPNVIYTTKSSDLKPQFYDAIFLYDVIDHCLDAIAVMKHIKSLLKPGGFVYVRCHPWTSKHATHLFRDGFNKAFIHLFLTEAEIKELGYTPMFTRHEKNPLEAYRWFFHEFKIEKEHVLKESLGDFFLVPSFKELVLTEQEIPDNQAKEFFESMQITFVDFRLTL